MTSLIIPPMMVPTFFVRVLNSRLRPERRAVLRPFAGRVLALRAGPVRVLLRVGEEGDFSPLHSAAHADAEMEAFSGLNSAKRVAGDPEFLRAAGEALRSAAMDLESHPVLGPLALMVRAACRAGEVWAPRVGEALTRNDTVVGSEALSDFSRRVDGLMRGVSRLESAVAGLRRGGLGK